MTRIADAAIRVERLGKRYRIRPLEPYRSLRESLVRAVRAPFRRLAGRARAAAHEPFWALRDVSFTVERGDVVGVIGRNGAGKSTLLKILSRITEPTEGLAEIRGRIGSLLEVGTGFHPELTGRENIYLNGAVLGMRKVEIDRKFDAIVDFAEVERFLDLSVKHYSSGMYMRLAFAVAAHLEPEILVVDEVLAVGDVAFQKKCLGKMGQVAKEGRTVLFVSHAMAAVQALCSRGIVLADGRAEFDGPIGEAVECYLRSDRSREPVTDLSGAPRSGTGEARLVSFYIEDASGRPASSVPNGRPCTFVLRYRAHDAGQSLDGVAATVSVRNLIGTLIFYHHNLLTGQAFDRVEGAGEFRLRIPRLPLSPGDYHADLNLTRDRGRTLLDSVEGRASFEVSDGDFFGSGFEYKGHAAVLVDGSWQHHPSGP